MDETTTNDSANSPGAETVESPSTDAPDVPKRRGRGRPPKADPASPEKETASAGTGTPRARKTAGKAKVDAGQMAQQIMGLHQIAFMMTGQQFPELILAEHEAVAVAQAVSGVCDQYDLRIDGKTGAFLQLAATAAMVYAPRLLSIRAKIHKAKPVDVQSKTVPDGS